jgi:hypothetical protein
MKVTAPFLILFKSFLHIIVDCCIMPGTANGTLILYSYALQWKNKISVISFALLFLISSIESPDDTQAVSQQSFTDPEAM